MTFALTPASAPVVQGLPGGWLQVRNEGVALGAADVEVIDFVTDPDRVVVSRGIGENAHVITVRYVVDETCFTETYVNGLDDYVLTHGPDKNDYSIVSSAYGNALRSAASTVFTRIRKDIGADLFAARFSFYVWTGTTQNDDATSVGLIAPGDVNAYFEFIPKREVTYDPARRMMVGANFGGPYSFYFGTALAESAWYFVDVTFASGVNASQIVVMDAVTMLVHASQAFSVNGSGSNARYIVHSHDASAGLTSTETKYARVKICDYP